MEHIIITRVTELAEAKGEKPTTSMKAAGVGKNFFYNIRERGATPSIEKINKLATYFGVSTDYILGIEKPATPKEQPATRHDELMSEANNELKDLPEGDLENILDIVRAYKRK